MASNNDDEMLRMSFIEHLTELRARLLKSLFGLAIAYVASLTFTDPLWRVVCRPAAQALQALGYPPQLYILDPVDGARRPDANERIYPREACGVG
jgi:sec-independent protein translocase protein TatC